MPDTNDMADIKNKPLGFREIPLPQEPDYTRSGQKDLRPNAVKYRITEFFDPTTNTLTFKKSDGTTLMSINTITGTITLSGPTNFNQLVTMIANNQTYTSSSATNMALSMKNVATKTPQAIKLEVTATGYGFLSADELLFNGNTGNIFKEAYGPVAQLADTGGFHAFRVQDSSSVEAWRFASDGSAFQGKAKSFVLKGNIAAPGGQGTDTAAIYVDNGGVGGKHRLMVEFNTGASQVIASEP